MTQAKRKTRFEAGPVTFVTRHELWDGNIHDHADQGVSIRVMGQIDGKETMLIRFNCFDLEKSYTYGPENPDLNYPGPMMLAMDDERPNIVGKKMHMDEVVIGNPIGWTIKTLSVSLKDMLEASGYPEIAAQVDMEVVQDVLPELEATARDLFLSERNTVKHNRGTHIYEAGNVKFGLEMRRLPVGDGGLAVHLLADIGGSTDKTYVEETEIMAFDCFWDGPHYHYGPRNKNHRIYWDRTLVKDPLGWVFDQLEGRKLKDMIERAGYHMIAADLDIEKVESILPEVKAKAREMQAEGEKLTGHPGLPLEPTPNLVPN